VIGRFNIDLDPQLTQWAPRREPGCAIGLIDDGRLVYSAGFGVEDVTERRPISAESRFDIASEAKQFTAACIALLERERRIAPDDPIGQILPELPEVFRRISIEQLLHHTSGIPDFFLVLRERDMLDSPCVLQTVYEVLREMRSTEFPPGERFGYSNSGYALLALIAERVEGSHFAEIIQRRIFGPLGMSDSFVHDTPGATYAHHAKGHVFEEGFGYRECWHPRFAVPGAGCLYSSVRDLARWMTGLHGGSRAILLHAPRDSFSVILLCNNRRIDHATIAIEMARRLAAQQNR
jgi:CubicO group peptidase (beta-lactamase class C family)